MKRKTVKRTVAGLTATRRGRRTTDRSKILATPGVTLARTERRQEEVGGFFVVDKRIDLYRCAAKGKRTCWIMAEYILGYPSHPGHPHLRGEPDRLGEHQVFWGKAEAFATFAYGPNTLIEDGLAVPAAIEERRDRGARSYQKQQTEQRAKRRAEEEQAPSKVAALAARWGCSEAEATDRAIAGQLAYTRETMP